MEPTLAIVRHEETPTAVVRGQVTMDALPGFYDRAFGEVATSIRRQGATPQAAFGYYLSPPQDTFELEVGFAVDRLVETDGEVVPSLLPGGEVARTTHVGPYDGLGQAWGALMEWVQGQGRQPTGPMWEVYVTEPTPESDPATLRTDLFCLLA